MAFLMQRNPRLTVFYFLKTNNKHKEEIYLLIYYKLNRAEQIYMYKTKSVYFGNGYSHTQDNYLA